MKIIVLGAGSWGTALAVHAASGLQHEVILWTRNPCHQHHLQADHENRRYLPQVNLPRSLVFCSSGLATSTAWLNAADLVVLATPMSAIREMLGYVQSIQTPVAWLCKGFEAPVFEHVGLLAHEIQATVAPNLKTCVLSGPSFAQEVAMAQPTALVAASVHDSVRQTVVAAFHSKTLRVYAHDDVTGVEVAGAVKNVLAIATGLCDGLSLGLNARAALITRGLAEMTRLGVALGARAETFRGLSGLGDLVLTATGHLSRNRQVGLSLAAGQSVAQAVAALGHVAEGVYSARTVVLRAAQLGVEMPIAQAVVAVLDGHWSPRQALTELMSREPTVELT